MKLTIIISILLFAIEIKAQSLTLSDLQTLCKKQNWEVVDNYLSRKGWKYHDSKQGSSSQYSTITYSYGKNSWDDRAQGWFYVYAYNNEVHKITYSCGISNTYNSIKNSLIANGYKKTGSQILDQRISTTYENSLYKIEVCSEQAENDDYDTHYDWYFFYVIRKNGVYDSDNGPVTNYWYDGATVREEYTLKDGKYNGVYKSYTSDGELEISLNFVNGKKQGKGVAYWETGGRREMNFLNDELTGIAKSFDENGTLRRLETYSKDKKNGKYVEYDEKGVRLFEATMKEDSVNGKYTYYLDDGVSVAASGTKIMGVEDGAYVSYYDKEHKNVEGNYKNGEKIGKWISYPNPDADDGVESMRVETNYNNGEEEGLQCAYDKTGKLVYSEEYQNGLSNGECIIYTYDDNGELIIKEIQNYYEGEKHGRYSYNIIGQDTTLEIKYANYAHNKKNGMAKMNFDDYVVIANYKNDYLNGTYEKYMEEPFHYDLNKIPIDFKDIKNLWLKSKYTYKDNILDGPFTEYVNCMQNTRIWQKGFYKNGKKDFCWETYRQNYSLIESDEEVTIPGFDFEGKPLEEKKEPEELLYTQTYSNGELNGLTASYLRHGESNGSTNIYEKCEIKAYFKNGKYDGAYSSKNKDGEIEYNGYFKDGHPTAFTIYTKPDNNKLEHTFNSSSMTQTLYMSSGNKIIMTYTYTPNNWPLFDSTTISTDFDFSNKASATIPVLSDITLVLFYGGFKKETIYGLYEEQDKLGNIIVTGFLNDKEKYGLWQYYHRDQNVRITQNKSNSNEPTHFYTLDDQLFSGEYTETLEYQGSTYDAIFKVKNGLLDGKTKYNDPETGKTMVSFKYKEGVLEK